MSKFFKSVLLAGFAALVAAPSANAISLTTSAGPVTTTPGAVTFYDFDGVSNTSVGTFTSLAFMNQGTSVGSGNFISLNTGQLTTLNLVDPVSYVGFLLGSPDGYNSFAVYNGISLLATYTGQPSVNPNGFTFDPFFVNITAGAGEAITRIDFSSSGCCMEMDNFASSNSTRAVPGPVVGAGLPGLVMAFGGFLAWRRRKAIAA